SHLVPCSAQVLPVVAGGEGIGLCRGPDFDPRISLDGKIRHSALKARGKPRWFYAFAFTTFCRCSPKPSMPSVTTSPALRNFGSGFMPSPTPGGVPVRMTSPGSSTKYCEQHQTRCLQSKIMVPVLPRWRFCPLTSSHMLSRCGSLISSLVTSHGPSGPELSALLRLTHCPLLSIWNRRSDTSLPRQYPATTSSALFFDK